VMSDISYLEAIEVSKVFGRKSRSKTAVDGVSLSVKAGDSIGIVGESGSGKSTMARMLVGLLSPNKGLIAFNGEDVSQLRGKHKSDFRKDVQMVFQDPYASLNPRMKIFDQLAEGPRLYQLYDGELKLKDAIEELFMSVGMSIEHLNRYPREFSGGQRQRICIARALAVQPRILICDEPVSSLDVSIQAQILNLLKDKVSELNLTLIFVAHDLAVVKYLCSSMAVMERGKIVEQGDSNSIFRNPTHEYTKSLLKAIPTPNPIAERERLSLAKVQ